MEYDRSRFIDREVLDPHHVMQAGPDSGAVGVHTAGNLDFLKEAVDLGAKQVLLVPEVTELAGNGALANFEKNVLQCPPGLHKVLAISRRILKKLSGRPF